jgi:aspartate-semialdehyde dehydrogenase|tara:strand:- start:4431 stop:5471 length:1041 start_codon:yes stop_codon:yes gene_type:complete
MDVAVLGATGMVGQRFIEGLLNHPSFNLTTLAASSKSAGKRYSKVAKWYLQGEMPSEVKDTVVVEVDPKKIRADIVFSALPSAIAKEVEPKFAEEGSIVASNASSFRMDEDVPLIIPEVNPDHLNLIEVQRERRGWDGAIITNPNCTVIMGALSMKPIQDNFGIENVILTSMQALSGAGYSGIPSMSIVDNVIPYIKGEEEKVEEESRKIFGEFNGSVIEEADLNISASCNRVAVLDGHTESIFIKTKRSWNIAEIKKVMQNFKGLPQELNLPTSPANPIIVKDEVDRPQPRLDRLVDGGMAVSVGQIRKCSIMDFKYTVMGHNTIRGAAGASILNAELLCKTNRI